MRYSTAGSDVTKSDNRAEFIALLAAHGLTQAKAADLICEYTHRPCSVRAIRTWVNNPEKPSSRNCPEWAVNALREALAERMKAK